MWVMVVPSTVYSNSPDGISAGESFQEAHFYYANAGFQRGFWFQLKEGSWQGVFWKPEPIEFLTEEKGY